MSVAPLLNRRSFLASTSCFGAAFALAKYLPLPALAEDITQGARVSAQPIAERGYASIRKIGDGAYATISDPSKGLQTLCNGGFLVGKESALIVEGYRTAEGARFQVETLHSVSQVPIRAAIDSHYHFDHSMGNATYGAHDIPVWAHARTPSLMLENYARVQGQDHAAMLAPLEKAVTDAANETARARAQGNLNALKMILQTADATVIALPNHPLDPARLPLTVDLGGPKAVIETYPGHTPGDIIVRVPEQNIVFTGDLLFNGWYPVTFDADIHAWRATLAKFAGFDKDTLFVPGHGQLCGQEGIAKLRDVFDDMAAQARKFYDAGVPAEEAEQRYVVPEKFKDFPIFAWRFTVGTTIQKLYAEFRSGM